MANVRLSESVFTYSILLQQYSMLTGLPSDSFWSEAKFDTHEDENGEIHVYAPPSVIEDFQEYLNSADISARIAEYAREMHEEGLRLQAQYAAAEEAAGELNAEA